MREILFRGKRIDNGQWVEGGFTNDAIMLPRITTIDKFKEGLVFNMVIPETVGQFTGLIDKNGVKIFEGDILFGKEEGNGEMTAWTDVYYSIIFDDKEAGFFATEKVPDIWACSIRDINQYYEVIDNIHDNPELLNQ